MITEKAALKCAVGFAAAFLVSANALAQTVVYDNTTTYLDRFIAPPAGSEIGDQINLNTGGGVDWFITEFNFEYFNSGTQEKTGQLFLRAMDGPQVAVGDSGETTSAPGSVLFTSDEFTLNSGFQLVEVGNLNVQVPADSSITWSVRFNGFTAPDEAGLTLFHPPTIGSSFGDYWARTDTGDWQLRILEEGGEEIPVNFAAQVTAVPEPGTYLLGLIGAAGLWFFRRRNA